MARMTLLEIVQDVLNDMDSFDVNSISDTVESEQVAQIVKTTFFDIVSDKDWAYYHRTFQLDSATVARPTHMALPQGVKRLDVLKYNKKTASETKVKYTDVLYMEPADFLTTLNGRDSTDSAIDSITDPGGITLLIKNDTAPSYWTSFDDQYIVMDSYDSAVDSFLQNSKTQCLGVVEPSWTHTDAAYPDIPDEMFSYLLNEAKSRAFYVLKQMPNEKAERASTVARRRMSRKAWQAKGGIRYPNYGRTPAK